MEDVENLIGFFLNNIVLRTHLDSKASFGELLKQVKSSTVEAFKYQDLPFEKIVQSIIKERDLSRSPVFQVMFILQNTPQNPALKLGGLQLQGINTSHHTAKFEITLSLTETKSGLSGSVEYNVDLFKSSTIDRQTGQWLMI